MTQAIEWARKVAASKPPRYTDASRNAAAYILEREAAEAASKAREAALVEALERIDLMCPVTCDITVAHEMADIARAALTKEPDA